MLRFWRHPALSLGQDHVLPDTGAHNPPTSQEWSNSRNCRAQARGYIHGGPWHRVFETHSHCPVSPSPIPKPEGRVTAGGEQQPKANTSTIFAEITRSLHGDDFPCVAMGIPLEIAEVQDLIWVVGPHCSLPGYSKMQFWVPCIWHDDLFHEPSGLGSYFPGRWLLYAHPPRRGGHRIWLGPPPTQWQLFTLHWQLCIFPWLCVWLFSCSNCSPLTTVLNCLVWHACPICFMLVFALSILIHTYHT